MKIPWNLAFSSCCARLIQCLTELKSEDRSSGCFQRPGDWWPEPGYCQSTLHASKSFIAGRTHFNKSIQNQLPLGLAIGGGCRVVRARDHFVFTSFWRTVIFSDDVRDKVVEGCRSFGYGTQSPCVWVGADGMACSGGLDLSANG